MNMGVLDLVPLLRLRRLLNLAFAPVLPRPEYRVWLGRKLVTDAAHMQVAQQPGMANGLLSPGRRGLLIGAAVGSALSLAGLLAILLSRRGGSKRPDQQAA